jgi:hypothetical protein
MAHLVVFNERIKYTATWLNTVSIGFLAIGVITPVSALVWNEGSISDVKLLMTLGWPLASIVLHLGVRALLGRLRE